MRKLLALFALAVSGYAACPQIQFNFTGIGSTQTFDNRQAGCNNWVFAYQSTGFSAISLRFESASGANSPGSFGAFSGTIVAGANPSTNTTANYTTATGYVGWYRVTLTSATGTGTIRGVILGLPDSAAGGGSGGSCGTFTGDLTGTCPAATVVAVNGVAIPASPSTSQVAIVTASNTLTYKTIPLCDDSGGQHLNWTTIGFNFSCGVSGALSPYAPLTAPPALAGFTVVNSASAVQGVNNFISITQAAVGSNTVVGLVKTLPATPYTKTIALTYTYMTNFNLNGFLLRESGSGKLITFGPLSNNGFVIEALQWSSPTSPGSTYFTGPATYNGPTVIWLQVSDDGTTCSFNMSVDGWNYITMGTRSHTDFITADQYGFFENAAQAAGSMITNLVSFN